MSRKSLNGSAASARRPEEDGELHHSLRDLSVASSPNTKRASADTSSSADAVCPVCKSSRYLNRDLQFRINPECYHKMCESCVDRIFSQGPAMCPIAGCRKTLRKVHFRRQTFDDIRVEREVDIRRRVNTMYALFRLVLCQNYLRFYVLTNAPQASTAAKANSPPS